MPQTMPLLRLHVEQDDTGEATFYAEFAAVNEHTSGVCAPARLEFGDGSSVEVGILCAPTLNTWREARTTRLASHTYASPGPFEARLTWGDREVTTSIPGSPRGELPPLPQVTLFEVVKDEDNPLQATVRVQLSAIPPDTQVRVDGGAGQVYQIQATDGEERAEAWSLSYAKPGTYTVAADLLDKEGFWLATLAETEVVIGELETGPERERLSVVEPPSAAERIALEEMGHFRAELPVWLPFRYARPVWANARAYVSPGGGRISRLLIPGTYISIHDETVVNDTLWYLTGSGDWVPAHSVVEVQPSDLRGVQLRGVAEPTPPPPPPPSEPGPVRKGVVTAYVLNVRARPGVRPDNPPIDRLRRGTEVTIYEEAPYEGEIWYRIGDSRWVHSGWVRVVESLPRAKSTSPPTKPMPLPVGWVVASALNVRARPGVSEDNPPIDRLHYKDVVRILEERTVQGATWYRIGEDRWVYGGWVGVARYKPRPSAIRPDEHWVGVCLKEQTAVAYEGDEPVYAALVATGRAQFPTVRGIFRTWLRRKWGKMSGGTPGTSLYYYLEDVTWTMYFYQGYALHATYWHDAFGRPRSRGCVNMSPYDAWWVFNWSAEGGKRSPAVYVYWI